jgi:hypothetical protein
MTKRKVNCRYELLCLLNEKKKNKEKYEKMIANMERLLGKENITKVEEKKWKPVDSKLSTATYVLIYFTSERPKAQELKEKILQTTPKDFLKLSMLLNLEDEKYNKIKLIKKDKDVK